MTYGVEITVGENRSSNQERTTQRILEHKTHDEDSQKQKTQHRKLR